MRSPDLGRWWSVTVLSVQSRTVVMTCQSDKRTRGRRWPAVEGSLEDVFITRRPSHAGEAENSLGLIGPHVDFWALWRGGPIRAGPKMNELHCGGTPVSPTLTRCLGCCVSRREGRSRLTASTLEPHVSAPEGWPPDAKGAPRTGRRRCEVEEVRICWGVGERGTQSPASVAPGGGGANFAEHSDR